MVFKPHTYPYYKSITTSQTNKELLNCPTILKYIPKHIASGLFHFSLFRSNGHRVTLAMIWCILSKLSKIPQQPNEPNHLRFSELNIYNTMNSDKFIQFQYSHIEKNQITRKREAVLGIRLQFMKSTRFETSIYILVFISFLQFDCGFVRSTVDFVSLVLFISRRIHGGGARGTTLRNFNGSSQFDKENTLPDNVIRHQFAFKTKNCKSWQIEVTGSRFFNWLSNQSDI